SYIGDKPIGFMLWEVPLKGKMIGNCMVHCTLYDRGLSELLHYEMAKSLYEDGVEYLCLGGAETEGLDFFKRKMNPINSIELVTITL
ncbi:MAG TPA: hypothetical protein PLF01_07355, partial [Alphaproteobacteria bacterium]|nr:hypothetical protein [Alphaproteobacteria bacterium]